MGYKPGFQGIRLRMLNLAWLFWARISPGLGVDPGIECLIFPEKPEFILVMFNKSKQAFQHLAVNGGVDVWDLALAAQLPPHLFGPAVNGLFANPDHQGHGNPPLNAECGVVGIKRLQK